MAQGFFDAFSAALPQGVQLGMQQQQLEAQQADREAKRNAALWEQMGAIMKLPAGPSREAFLKLGAKQYRQMTGEDFPQEIVDLLNKGSEEELSVWTEAAGAFADFGFSVPAVARLMQTNPGAVAQMFTAVTGARKQRAEEKELEELRRIATGGGDPAPIGQPVGGGVGGELGPVAPGATR